MSKKIKNTLVIFILSLFSLFLVACSEEPLEQFYINIVEEIELTIGDVYYFDGSYTSSDDTIFLIEESKGEALNCGTVNITKEGSTAIIKIITIVDDTMPKTITIDGENYLKVNEETKLNATISPITASQEVVYESSDSNIITVDEEGNVKTLKEGFAYITVTSKINSKVTTNYPILVENEDEEYIQPIISAGIQDANELEIKSATTNELLSLLIKNSLSYVVGVEGFNYSYITEMETETSFGCGVIYKRDAILKNGETLENIAYDDLSEVKNFKYYIITTRNLVMDASSVKIYFGDDVSEYPATVLQYDDKIDLAVVSFESSYYYQIAEFADSDTVEQGEFIVSLGSSSAKKYFKSAKFGMVSYKKRYVSTDTDGDDVSDWDSEYIQHDATINECDNGGCIINLKGEVVGINSNKISATTTTVHGMSLAIPSNLALDIAAILITGKKLERPLLGVSIVPISAYIKNKEYYINLYPDMVNIPNSVTEGFYIYAISDGGVADMANLAIGDILIEFNGVPTSKSYILRAELNKFTIGSGDTTTIKVIRNGETLLLTVTF